MASWSKALLSRRLRGQLVQPVDVGYRQAWSRTFFGGVVVPVQTTLTTTASFFSATAPGVYGNALSWSAPSLFSAAPWHVQSDTNLGYVAPQLWAVGTWPLFVAMDDVDDAGHVRVAPGSYRYVNAGRQSFSYTPPTSDPRTILSGAAGVGGATGGGSGSVRPYGQKVTLSFTFKGQAGYSDAARQVLRFAYVPSLVSRDANTAYTLYGANAVIRERETNFKYQLLTNTPQTLEEKAVYSFVSQLAYEPHARAVDLMYALHVPQPTYRDLNAKYALVTGVYTERPVNLLWVQGLSERPISSYYSYPRADYAAELFALINALRVSLGLPTIRAYDGVGPDVAFRHSQNNTQTHIFAHESNLFPPGWQTVHDRLLRFNHVVGGMKENTAIVTSDSRMLYPTPQDLYDVWFNSQVHYDNMTFDWPEGSDPTFLLGIDNNAEMPVYAADGVTVIANTPGYWVTYITLNIVDMNLPGGGAPMQRDINFKWSQTSAPLVTFNLLHSQDAYTHAARSFKMPYALTVSRGFGMPWTTVVAAQYEMPVHYTVGVSFDQPYSAMSPVRSQQTFAYDVVSRDPMGAGFSMPYGISVAMQAVLSYASVPRVARQFGAEYNDLPAVKTSWLLTYEQMGPVGRQFSLDYSLRRRVSRQFDTPYTSQYHVAMQAGNLYDLLVRNPTRAQYTLPYMLTPAATSEIIDVAAAAKVYIRGMAVGIDEVSLSTSEDEFVWTARMSLTDQGQYAMTQIDDPVRLVLGGVEFILVVTGKALDRSEPARETFTLTAVSPAVALSNPRSGTIKYELRTPKQASTVVAELLGVAVQWDILDWVIPAAYFAVEDVEPISAARTVVQAAGGILESLPDGSLRARYRFPVSVPDFPQHVSAVLTDTFDQLSYGETFDTQAVYDKFRIRDGSGTVADTLEFQANEDDDRTGELRAHVMPWRAVEINFTGPGPANLVDWGIRSRSETEIVEIVDGKAGLKYPAVSLTEVVWLSDPVGNIILDARTRDIVTDTREVNYGYGVARITYVVEYYGCGVHFADTFIGQFLLIDKG